MSMSSSGLRPSTNALLVGALGVVFGDIGTSPLYAFKECFNPKHVTLTPGTTQLMVLGVLSLMFWALIIIVSIKYLCLVMRASNKGEGGILVLLALAVEKWPATSRRRSSLLMVGVFGATLLYGEGIITPAITTLGAMEGLTVATEMFRPFVVPLTMAVVIGLFSFQRIGTERVGRLFGPVMLLWFGTLATLGVYGIVRAPEVLTALNPWHAVQYLSHTGWHGFLVLGSVVLVVTGCEALYADMGHFGIAPIRRGWFAMVLPALLLNYFGQGALLLSQPELQASASFNPFFMLAPSPWVLYPLVVLSTAAAVIASQALITGSYSLTLQAMQLGFLPRVSIRHTSAHTRGQIYISVVNWALMLSCLAIVYGFGSSEALAGAYGVGVTLTMLITSLLISFVARDQWGWKWSRILPLMTVIVVIEGAFFAANSLKIASGGWLPLAVGAALFTVMTTWRLGRHLVAQEQADSAMPQEMFCESIKLSPKVTQVPGTAIFMCGSRGKTPVALLHNLKHNKVLHERVVFLTIVTDDVPYVVREQQVEIEQLQPGIYRLTGHYGFMQEPNVPQLLRRARNLHGFDCDAAEATFFLGRETIVPSKVLGMALWREHLFSFLSRVAQSPAHYFKLPENRVIEVGVRVRI
ncbi:MAG: potassium transporter Kup [Verrucomicrobiales bacterium]